MNEVMLTIAFGVAVGIALYNIGIRVVAFVGDFIREALETLVRGLWPRGR